MSCAELAMCDNIFCSSSSGTFSKLFFQSCCKLLRLVLEFVTQLPVMQFHPLGFCCQQYLNALLPFWHAEESGHRLLAIHRFEII